MKEEVNKKSRKSSIVLFIIIALVLAGNGLYLYSNKDNNEKYYTKE